jgi:hypothetical protein
MLSYHFLIRHGAYCKYGVDLILLPMLAQEAKTDCQVSGALTGVELGLNAGLITSWCLNFCPAALRFEQGLSSSLFSRSPAG